MQIYFDFLHFLNKFYQEVQTDFFNMHTILDRETYD